MWSCEVKVVVSDLFPVEVPEPIHAVDELLSSHVIDDAEWTATRWREADAEDGPDVPVPRTLDDPILKAQRRFVNESEDHAVLTSRLSGVKQRPG